MKRKNFDAVVIGGGAAGMAAALEIEKNGFSVAVIEREPQLGGILIQCIHNGFGLHEFKEELTGPEYAERVADTVREKKIGIFCDTTVMEISDGDSGERRVFCYSFEHGVFAIHTRAIILAMGCRERNRGNIGVPGSRPSGVYTAGLAQRLLNIEGYMPGKEVLIVGSGDIGLIMARRMAWAGAHVHGVVEIQPYPAGLTRNIVQCLHDFRIPLYLSHVVTNIYGRDRVERVDITPMVDGAYDYSRTFQVECDTLLLSVGLVPENELAKKIGVTINPQTNGPVVDSTMMTDIPGVFACGNLLHVHDLVDFVSEESRRTGSYVSKYLGGSVPGAQHRVKTGANVRYIVPNRFDAARENKFYLRSMIVRNQAEMEIKVNTQVVKTIKKNHIQPSEMISFTLKPDDLKSVSLSENSVLEISIL
jgi:NADPH-dependent 2,4-dienoyl-CoA reductase/sulfur reductase-like enzyme